MIEMQSSEWAGSRGYLCDVQGEVQVSIPACLWPVFVPLLSSSWGSLRDPTVLYLQSLGPMQSLGKLKSPGFTVTEALTCASAKRGQPTLLKVCSWTNLKTAPRPGPEANPGQGWSQ